jgi:hypothetical protein
MPLCECPLFVKLSKSVCADFPARRCHIQIRVRSDNEYFQSGFGNAQYFDELEAAYHGSSIVVPLTYNDPGEGRNFVNGTVRFTSFLPFVVVCLMQYVLTGCRGHIWVRPTLFVASCNPADLLMGEVWTHTHRDLIVLTQNYGILS